MKKHIGLAFGLLASYASSAENASADKALGIFQHLSSLAGTWQGSYQNGHKHKVEYKLIAKGSVLVETWTMSPTSQSMTVYTMEDDTVIAQHFCPQGNQVKLSLSSQEIESANLKSRETHPKLSESNKYAFSFVEGKSLQVPNKSHQYEFWIKIKEDGSFVRSETYRKNNTGQVLDEGEAVVYYKID